jgi:hypothetical protein
MQMSRLRVTGYLICGIAVLALVATVTVVLLRPADQKTPGELRSTYLAKARRHAELEAEFLRESQSMGYTTVETKDGALLHYPLAQDPKLVPLYQELAEYNRMLKEKYERAAANPAAPIPPDPPAPPEPK